MRVRQYFEQELRKGKRRNLHNILERTAATTGVSRATVSRIRTEDDLHNWHIESGSHFQVSQESDLPKSFETILRIVVRNLFLEKSIVPSVNRIYERITSLDVRHSLNMNLFLGTDIPTEESKLCVWSRSTLYRFMKKIVFVYDERISHYENKNMMRDIIKMRDDYQEWIDKYRNASRRIYYQDETWLFKNMVCNKIWKDIVGEATDDCFKVPSGKESGLYCLILGALMQVY